MSNGKTPPSCHGDGSVIFLKTSGPEPWLKVKIFEHLTEAGLSLEGKKKRPHQELVVKTTVNTPG